MRTYCTPSGLFTRTASVRLPLSHELFEIRIGSRLDTVRLCGVKTVCDDMPGSAQLAEMIVRYVFLSRVHLAFHGRDHEGYRLVAMKLLYEKTPIGRRTLNQWMIDEGYAVVVQRCITSFCNDLYDREVRAEVEERGLWQFVESTEVDGVRLLQQA
jgi:endonuclease YncB( thermonuclease family)